MNRKIQDSDREFIIARYRRDPYTFNAKAEAQKHKVSPMTIYNVLSKAGLKMKRGRKPLIPPQSPPLLNPSDSSKPEILVKPDFRARKTAGTGKGPPAIHPPKPSSPGSPEYIPKKSAD